MPAHFGTTRFPFPARTLACAALLLAACAASLPGRAVAPPGSGGMSADDAAEVLAEHNRARARVGVRPLVWDHGLAAMAGRHAETMARTCMLEHSGARGYGENLFMGTAGHYSPADGVRSWLEEGRDYAYRANSGRGRTVGHYTQAVWRDTAELGCGLAVGCGNMWMVCNYYPPGNYVGRRPY